MSDGRLTLFNLFGFKVRIDASWIVIALLVVWSLATGYFPSLYEDLGPRDYWLMAVIGALGLFGSIIVHEFCHSVVARHYDLPMKGITLFIFGGIAEMSQEPDRPKTEFLMAIAGPVSSFLLGVLFYGLERMLSGSDGAAALGGIFGYLAFINWLLAGFNMLPAFPLDGGRILRSILWAIRKDLFKATRTVCRIGSGFGIGLLLLGLFVILQGYTMNGFWYALIGLFLNGAARSSYARLKQRLSQSDLEGRSVKDS